MIRYAQLWAADPDAWRAAAGDWRAGVGTLDRREAELASVGRRLAGDWTGPAGRAALGRLDGLGRAMSDGRPALLEADQLLSRFADRLDRARALLGTAVSAAEGEGLAVDPRGAVSFGPAAPTGAEPGRARAVEQIRAALTLAGDADAETAGRLTALARRTGPELPADAPAGAPAPGAAPAAVCRWWDGLGDAARAWFVARAPALVGRLDGLPAAVRDRANRLLLGALRAELLTRRLRLLTGHRPPWVAVELSRLSRSLAGLDALSTRLAAPGRRAYLLGLDASADGRAVVAVGDPDAADTVLTYVPGMTADLADAAGELSRVERVVDRCAELAPADGAAGVLWLDYDAPDFLDEAARRAPADTAAPGLHRFVAGLRAGHDGGPVRLTVLGHSYGSLVVGSTARLPGFAADALVLVGSPGVGVEHAADLGLPAGRVWATTAGDDPIQYAARRPAGLLGDALRPVGPPDLPPGWALAAPGRELWFGRNPVDPAFGAGVFAGTPHGHGGYWDAGNPALDGMARIVLGGHP
ncbi:alpha/beta hydrolase [Plantactinospora siamensis]|uniref:Alpha/beta hydrolase n=1 Tax=Plantactinospora siamensis TaxID=555372 RepID=A0ABV6NQ04_9ACTN